MATPVVGSSSASGVRAAAARAAGRTGSEEFHSAPLSAAQEAAVLYAAGHADAAIRVLKSEIREPAGKKNKQAWLMLFDLHEAAQNRAEFDSLSMLFSVAFEQSPPVWAESAEGAGDPRRTQSRERKDFFALKPSASGDLSGEIEKFLAFTETMGTVRLDVSKVGAISAEDATLFVNTLQHLRKKKTPMWFNNLESLEKVLRAAFNEKATEIQRHYWLLLFELYILEGKMQEFEELGLEYAVAFEMSPPNWEVYVNPVSAAAAKTAGKPAPVAQRALEGAFEMKGVLSAASSNQIGELNGYAAGHGEVTIDMGRVLRIDFAYAPAFFEVVKAIQLAGKRVILMDLNELNAGLLEAFGFNRHAILVRRKST